MTTRRPTRRAISPQRLEERLRAVTQQTGGNLLNTAENVIPNRQFRDRMRSLARRVGKSTSELFQLALRRLVEELLRVVPVDTGRLYRSMRFNLTQTHLQIRFQAPYADYVNQRARLHKHYLQRGVAAGIRAANGTKRTVSDGTVVGWVFVLESIQRYGAKGAAEIMIRYQGI